MIYFDNAATTGIKPKSVTNAVNRALNEFSVNPGRGGYDRSNKCSEEIYKCRSKISEMFNAGAPERVIFTPNCTTSLNIVINGVCRSGDRVVASSLEHNAVARPLYKCQSNGVDVDFAEVIFGDSQATFRSFERLVTQDTRLVVCTHASNVTGEILPIERIGQLCAEKGVPFLVDAAQTAGVIPIDMKEMKIDYLCIAPHKGLDAPMGTGILIALGEIPETFVTGGTGSMSVSYEQPKEYPDRFESGTVNVPGIFGLSAGIDFVNREGIDNIYRKEMNLMGYIYDGLNNIDGVVLYTKRPKAFEFVPTLSFNIRGLDSNETASLLNNDGISVRAGLHCAPMAHKRLGTIDIGTVRICCSTFNSRFEADRLLMSVKNIVNSLKNTKKAIDYRHRFMLK